MRRLLACVGCLAIALVACSQADDPGGGGGPAAGGGAATDDQVVMARATWDTGFFQAEIHRQLIAELGYAVTDPAEQTLDADLLYPALARGDVDLWANGWFPLHDGYLQRERFTGQQLDLGISPVGTQIAAGALQGFLVDAASAEELGITAMADLADPEVAAAFDDDGDGLADLIGCDEGWGCFDGIERRRAAGSWGETVEQVSGDYGQLVERAVADVEAGDPTLLYTWTPNWTVDVLTPGEDVVWLEAEPAEEGPSEVADLPGCAGDLPCELGWVPNDVRAVANDDFLAAHPDIARLLEQITIPLADVAAQNARMHADAGYGAQELADDASTWIADNADRVDGWLATARDG